LGFGLGWWPYTQTIAKLDEPDEFIAAAVNELTYLMIFENLAHETCGPEHASAPGKEIAILFYSGSFN